MPILRVVWCLLAALACVSARPAVAQSSTAATDTYAHTIEPGDTIIGLSARLLADPRQWPTIQRLNRVRNPRRLQPGRQLLFPLDLMRSLPGSARVLWVRGQPRIEQPDGSGGIALLGATLGPGSRLLTGADESVQLELSTGSVVTIGAHARITIEDLRLLPDAGVGRTTIGVDRGRVEGRVTPATRPGQRYELRTPVVTTAVRGTQLRVGVDDSGTSVVTEVTEGRVAVVQGDDDVSVEAGFGTRARAGAPLTTPRALLPPIDAGRVEATTTRLPVRLQWPAVAEASAYRVRVTRPPDGAVVDEQTVSRPDVSWPDLADGSYTVAIRAIDADAVEGLDATWPLTVDARPVPPIASEPPDGAVLYGDKAALAWARPPQATAFHVQVAADDTFESIPWEQAAVGDTRVEAALPPGTWVWRIATRQGDERGPWSDSGRFTLRPRPPAGPPATTDLQKRALTLRWPAAGSGDRYGVQVSADPSFLSPVVDTEVDVPSLTVARPAPGTWYVRVRIVNSDGVSGPFGVAQSLVVPRPPRGGWWWLLLPFGVGGLVAAF